MSFNVDGEAAAMTIGTRGIAETLLAACGGRIPW